MLPIARCFLSNDYAQMFVFHIVRSKCFYRCPIVGSWLHIETKIIKSLRAGAVPWWCLSPSSEVAECWARIISSERAPFWQMKPACMCLPCLVKAPKTRSAWSLTQHRPMPRATTGRNSSRWSGGCKHIPTHVQIGVGNSNGQYNCNPAPLIAIGYTNRH